LFAFFIQQEMQASCCLEKYENVVVIYATEFLDIWGGIRRIELLLTRKQVRTENYKQQYA
jgi:hypothetical protein